MGGSSSGAVQRRRSLTLPGRRSTASPSVGGAMGPSNTSAPVLGRKTTLTHGRYGMRVDRGACNGAWGAL